MLRREQYFDRHKNGGTSPPSATGSVIGGIVGVVFGIIWISVGTTTGAPGIIAAIGVFIMIVALVSAIGGVSRATRYQDQERSYQQQRDQLMRGDSTQRY